MIGNLLAWNVSYRPIELFGDQLSTWSRSELPFSLSTLSGADVSANPGFNFFAVPVPQAGSSKIVFTSNRNGNVDIYSMKADGSDLVRLTADEFRNDHPRWSPDGAKVLFQSDRDNPENGKADIYVMNADGSGQTRLTRDVADDSAAAWSPDGNKIVFQSFRNGLYYQVYMMNADGTNQVNVSNGTTTDYQPSWSPDGAKIAFASERDHPGRTEIYVMSATGTNQTRLTFESDPFRDEQPAWSRDATKIAFVSTRDSVIETWQETNDEGGILNRGRIDINKEVYKMNPDGSNQIRLTRTLENDDSPSWSPDGGKIIFRSERERDAYDPTQQLWAMNADGTGQALINGNPFGDYSPSWNSSVANQPPVAVPGGPFSGLVAQNVVFNGSASFDPDGNIASYSWSFGDGGAGGTGATPTHSYTSIGTYTVTLTVTDNQGAHAIANTSVTITAATSEQYLANFNLSALAREAYTNESAYWNDILRSAYQNGQGSMLLSVRELGKTLFESSDYAVRNRNNHWYVYDLYKTYLMREPDASGWAWWENECNSYGRDNVRRAFDESGEFSNIVATLTPVGSPSSEVSSFASARVDPFNQPGNGLAARDTEWSVPLLSLPGRAGLDLGLSLSYSSNVWTRSGPYIYFDEDNGWPSPGFRLGFPTIQEKVFDAQAGDNVYLLFAGGRVSLRQMGASNVYEAADSSYLQLIDNGGSLLVRATDGTQLSYSKFNNEWHCTLVKDRNGNYLTVNYDWLGQITTVTDTLGRTISFNYDTNANLTSITQSWTVNGNPQTHTWASFGWTTKTLQPGFSGVSVVGASNGSLIPVLNQVGLDDGSYYKFNYNGSGLVERITHYASDSNPATDTHPLNYTAYDYEPITDDSPRLSGTRTWAENWTGVNGVPGEVVKQYGVEGNAHTLTVIGDPNGTLYKEFYGSGWQRGLTTQTEVWSAGVRQKWTTNIWRQDNESPGITYQSNPRVIETNVHDASNHRRTTIDYQTFTLPSGASCSLLSDIREYAGSASTALRRSHTDYRMDPVADAAYLSSHIIGLVEEQSLFEVNGGSETPMTKVGFAYDETGSIQGTDTPVGHDNSYDGNFLAGRGNLSSVKRFDVSVTNNSQFTLSSMKYNTAGALVSSTDPMLHQTTLSYADSFSDNNNRNTLAYPTTVTDADGYSSTATYNFDFGAVTRKQTPQPNTTANLPGPVQTFLYDAAGRIERTTALTNGAYVRYVYGPNYLLTWSTVNNVADEAYSNTVFDGLGRTVVTAANHPGSVGGYSARHTIYDRMGRAVKQSNPTETNGAWSPAGDDAGWLYTEQTYDWKGRPLVTTNPDTTTKEESYSGCGCAGGAVVTLTDEGTVDAGVLKRRQQKVYSDILGRTVKTELLNWEGGSPYTTTVNNYNARDQVTLARQYAGAEGSGSYQDTTITYDGYGRLKTKHLPEQQIDVNNSSSTDHTTWDYNADDTVQKVTDARGASQTFGYNHRHLLTGITYAAPAGIIATPNVSFGYDAARNRSSMTDDSGSVSYQYNQLSQLTSEIRQFTGLSGSHPLTYDYNLAGSLKSITDPAGATINYTVDSAGRTSAVTGSSFGGVTLYATNMQYRAWDAVKGMSYGNTHRAAIAYNARLQPTHFEIPGVISKDYQYQADGLLRYSGDLVDDRFDRSYSYDHSGRIKEAFSGPLARGEADTSNRPYKEYYQYDALDHLVGRAGSRHWTQPLPNAGVTDIYVNNRNPNWEYDADGRLTNGADIQSTFDAAGRATTVVSNRGHRTQTLEFDGEGRRSRMVETQTEDDGAGNMIVTTTTRYSVSSSVVGKVTTELDETAQKRRSFVYSGNQVLAWQQKSGSFEHVSWEYRDASEASYRMATANGAIDEERSAERDPLGSNAGLSDHFGQSLRHWPDADGGYPGFANLRDGDCFLSGLPFPCDAVRALMENGALGRDNLVFDGRRWRHLPPTQIAPRGLGIFVTIAPYLKPDTEPGTDPFVVRLRENDSFFILPQNTQQPTPTPDPCAERLLVAFDLRDAGGEANINLMHHSIADDFLNALLEINRVVPGGIGFRDVFRDSAMQARRRAAFLAGRGAGARRPGTSSHEAGMAVDVATGDVNQDVVDIFRRHGFGRPFATEPWHFEAGTFNANQIQPAQNYYNNCVRRQ